jgi:gliding motility-associated-like protein
MKPFLIIFLFFSSTAFAQVNLTQGLVAHYPFSGNANDVSGNNINGAVNNVTITTDRNGTANSAYHFNGTNSYIQLPFSNLYNFKPQDSFSISVWVLPEPGQTWIAQALVVKAPLHSDFTLSQWNYGSYMFDYKAMGGYAYNHILNSTTTLTFNPCWYNLITTYKNGVWKLYVNGILESSDFSQTKFILQDGTSRIALGKKGESFGDWYKGKMDDVRLYNRVLNQDEVNAIAGTCQTPCAQKNDFSSTQNSCIPYQFSFATTSTAYESITWNFGDGNSATGSSTVSHTYSAPGNYQVLMIQKYQNCIDTVRKTFNLSIQNDNQSILTPDTTFCTGNTKQLRAAPASTYCWSPATYLDNAAAQNPISSTPSNITYYLTSEKKGSNLIVNGDFSGGNIGFSSQYAYRSSNTTDGEYFVGNNPSNWYFAHFPCNDHTTGNGNMLLVNGSATADLDVWKTTVNVLPNTNYVFSTWISSISNPNPAQLAFSINGSTVGSLITASVPPCNWKQFYTTWNSGNATSAAISIINKNLVFFGNDFALDDISFTPVTITRDSVKLTVENCTANNCSQKNDFSFTQNVCTPYQFSFATTSTGYESITWNFGDGNSATGSSTVSHTYSTPGNFQVLMIQKYQNCIDTVQKTFTVVIQNDNQTIITPDSTICFGATKQLRGAAALSYCWSPSTYLSDPSAQNPVSSSPRNITYFLTSEKKGTNLIINGNFNSGNTGFTSAYNYATSNVTEGQYYVGASPQAWNSSLSNCGDHTTGNGNMMLVNGAPAPNTKVWTQTVTVLPNTNYSFATWIQALWPPNPAQLQFSINNIDIGTLITASLPTCTWTQFYTTWNSGNATSATISIINKNTLVIGNDFALDDISFTPVIISRDSVKISVDTPLINTSSDSAICTGSLIQINTTGALNYVWSPANGLSNTSVSNPIAAPSATTKYIVTGTNSFGCSAKDSITVTVNPTPTITLSNDTLVCSGSNIQLVASGGTAYSWSPVNTLSNAAIANPVATPSAGTTYHVTVTNAANCSSSDSIRVDVRQLNTFSISPSRTVCIGDSVQLIATGGDIYNWSPSSSLSNANLANPFAYPVNTTDYDVIISDTLCNISETLTATVTVNPLPVLNVSKSNDVDCSNAGSQLSVTGAIEYAWLPSGTLNNSMIRNPIASPLTTTRYFVTGKDINGCINTDSITVFVTADNAGNYLIPNAFTPNNDGINDCFGIKNWGPVTNFEFSIYNRWGQLVFYTIDPTNCWNGNFKAEAQNAGMYAYTINARNACGVIKRNGLVTLVR